MEKIITIIIAALLLFSACDENEVEFVPYEPKIVVEGYIENDNYPSVMLSISSSMTGPKDTLSLLNQVIKGAKVTVSNDEMDEVLILQTNKDRFPPYEYKGYRLKGEPGKSYQLKVEYGGKILTSVTTIPDPVVLDSIWFKKSVPDDTVGYIHISFKNTTNDYYLIATKKYSNRSPVFTPCLYGNIDNKVYEKNEKVFMQVNKGATIYPEKDYTSYFNVADTILLRFSTHMKDSYDFWTSYQNEILNAQNPLFPANTSLKSNIEGDAIGVWCGLGSNFYQVIPEKYSE